MLIGMEDDLLLLLAVLEELEANIDDIPWLWLQIPTIGQNLLYF